MPKRIPSVPVGLTRDVGHSSTEPRAPGSNPGGRANPSGNINEVAGITARTPRGFRKPRPFWSLADKSGGDTACWPWLGRRDRQGYGVYDANLRAHRAHRVAMGIGLPVGAVVRHRCDNPSCVNPAHLEAGTQGDNIRDMYDRERRPLKLTRAQRQELRSAVAGGGRGILTRVARLFGVTPQYAGRIAKAVSP